MSKIFNYYSPDDSGTYVDHVWYDSSNVKYTECIDNDNELKTLRVVFSNGTQYEYNGVNVNDYLLLRENVSQGKALNTLIKSRGYEYKKLDNADLESLNDELYFRTGNGYSVSNDEDGFEIKDKLDESVFKMDKKLDNDTYELLCDVLKAVNITFKKTEKQ